MARDVAVISLHEKGFWQGDLYLGAEHWDDVDWGNGVVSDSFFTLPLGQTKSDAEVKAKQRWPTAMVVEGIAR